MPNPYQVLGVSPLAGPEEIKSAYRRLAKTYHPDAGTNDPAHHERFHEVTAAYDLLRRKAKAGENGKTSPRHKAGASAQKTDEKASASAQGPQTKTGEPKPEPASGQKQRAADTSAAPKTTANNSDRDKTEGDKKSPPFSDFLANLKSAGKRAFRPSGPNHDYEISIPLLDAVNGTKRRLTLKNNKSLEVHIPAGVEDGQQIRLRGQGGSGVAAIDAGDAMVTICVAPHPVFTREGADIHIDAAVSLPEAVLGAKITVPTIDGDVALNVPAGSNSGSVLRLKGKGLPYPPGKRRLGRGDQYVRLSLVLPPKPDDALKDFVATWAAGLNHKPRKG